MGKKVSAVAMLAIAITVMFLVPVSLGKLRTHSSGTTASTTAPYTEASATTTEDSPAVTAAPVTEAAPPDITTASETQATAVTTVTEPEETETVTTTVSTAAKAPETKKTTTTTAKKATTTTKETTTTAKKTAAATTTTKKATTTTKKKTENKNPAPSGTPVAKHGQLSVKGANIVDENGKVFQLIGMSTHGIMWETFGDILSKDSLKVLRDDWGCNAIRIAMYTEEWGGYTTGSDFAGQAKQKVNNGVANATDLGMYVIIDWHILSDGNPQKHQSEAVAFFTEMAKKYKDYNNVIYEICNEPNGGVNWSSNIKPYAEKVISAIRSYDKDAIIVCGTGTWSQDIDQVLGNTLSDKNTVYALHFYANTHTDWLRNRLQQCYNKGLPVLVSEFGTCDASGNGGFNSNQTKQWFTLLDKLNIGYFNWSAANKSETASAFKSGTNLKAIKAGTSQLTDSGKIVREQYRKRAGLS